MSLNCQFRNPVEIEVSNITVISEEKEYNRLNFDYHVNQLCKKVKNYML